MNLKIVLFTQPGCLSCELMKVYLEARELSFSERDIVADPAARQEMIDEHDSLTTPTIVVISGETVEVIVGFAPERLDELLAAAESSEPAPGPSPHPLIRITKSA
ncbi:MAG: glutaredoxin domain-containing protein [Candidatus Sulfotelmatobacter sp.]